MKAPAANSQDGFESLIEQARGGCAVAAGQLFEHCRGYLLAIANGRLDEKLQSKLGGSDLVQQTLMHAHCDMAGFRGRCERELFAWLQQILNNEIARAKRDYIDTAKRDLSREITFGQRDSEHAGGSWFVADTETPSRHAVDREDEARLVAALARLSLAYRTVIELRNRDLLTFSEIGGRMSLGEETARRLWTRALEGLRQELVAANGELP